MQNEEGMKEKTITLKDLPEKERKKLVQGSWDEEITCSNCGTKNRVYKVNCIKCGLRLNLDEKVDW